MLHAEMMDRLSIHEFNRWVAFHNIQQRPEVREQSPEQILAAMDGLTARRNRA